MPLVIAQEDVQHTRTSRMREGGIVTRTDFLYPPAGSPDPHCYLVEESPGRVLRAHFHEHDQFQVFLSGSGTVGQHAIDPVQVHFSRKHTPYGPLVAASHEGYSYLTLRNEWDAGAQFMPDHRGKLDSVPDRKPWQISVKLDFPPASDGVTFTPIPGVRDERGLDAQVIRMPAGARASAPDVSASAGQYVVILEGSLLHEGRACKPLTVVHLRPPEGPFLLQAGPQGLLALALNFPRQEQPAAAARPADGGELKVWQCVLCGFLYDEAAGAPEQGIDPGTRWADVPESFGCPDCSATKKDFEMMEI